MKRTIIAAVVGGLIIFIWQFLSYALINFHEPAQAYTEKQETIMNFLATQNLQEGGYIMPSAPKTASSEEWEKMMAENEGKPWVSLQYHNSLNTNMGMNMVRGLLTNIIIVFIFCWLIAKMRTLSMGEIFLSAVGVGLIVFLNGPYTGNIWYEFFDIWAHFADAVVSWALVGLWLGFWLRRGNKDRIDHKKEKPSYEMAS